MPFTPSHAVVALPFIRTPLVPAAIAVGAMIPDLPLFVRGFPLGYGRTHDLLWLPVTVVVALAALLVWRLLLRPAAGDLVPGFVARRMPVGWDSSPRASVRETFTRRGQGNPTIGGVAILLVSLALGVVSHIAWDAFTHEGRWGEDLFPLLAEPWGPLTGVKWLQYGSGVAGLVIIGIWVVLRLRAQPPRPFRGAIPAVVRWVWWVSLPVSLISAWIAGALAAGPFTATFTPAHLAYRVLPSTVGVWGLVTVVLCVVISVIRARHARDDARIGASGESDVS